MKIYLTTDTHLGHDQLVEYCGRPENHSQIILDELRKVPKDSILIHLGDVCIGCDAIHHTAIKMATEHLKRRILVRGNHDNKSDSWYLDHGWDFVCKSFEAKYFGSKILFSHKPVVIPEHVDFNVHGHFHNSDHRRHEPELRAIYEKRHRLLAIENTGLKPVNLEKFLSLNQ